MLGNGFTRKKVGSLTLGEKLQKIRADYRISLAEVSKSTGIRKEHLECLEKSDYTKLPADVYVRGFLRSYAQFLGADPKALIRLYERERSIAKNLSKEPEREKKHLGVGMKHKQFSRFILTPKLIVGIVAVFAVLGVAGYLYREFHAFISEPYLVVFEPSNNQTISADKTVVSGKTDRDAKLFLNNEPTLVNEGGEFHEEIHLQQGVNTVTVKVVNRFGKERSDTISVVAEYVVPESTPPPVTISDIETPPKVKFILSTTKKKSVFVVVRVDGDETYRGLLAEGEEKTFECEKECAVDSNSARDTLVAWNGDVPKALGEKSDKVENVIFTVLPVTSDTPKETKEEVSP